MKEGLAHDCKDGHRLDGCGRQGDLRDAVNHNVSFTATHCSSFPRKEQIKRFCVTINVYSKTTVECNVSVLHLNHL